MYAKIILVCQACRSPEIEIVEYENKKPSTDIEYKYFKCYCPRCGNFTHSFFGISGFDIVKLVKYMKYEREKINRR